ncbi:MAG: phenylalanine--tRNA ligase subunit alpha, partial [Leptolyngbyaceae cyanobacterium MAG.088]|nr:phenylalanine--tRNA ligase subunit alpha [Leptolyngbyaceae cyanobacterium MAG.088]
MTTDLEQQLSTLQQEASDEIATLSSLDELDQFRVSYLGKKGKLSKILGGMGKLSAEDRPRIGALANQVKGALQVSIDERKAALQNAKIQAQ